MEPHCFTLGLIFMIAPMRNAALEVVRALHRSFHIHYSGRATLRLVWRKTQAETVFSFFDVALQISGIE